MEADARWQAAVADLEAAEALAADPRTVHVGEVAFRIDDLLL